MNRLASPVALLALYAGFVVYGSLVPLDFQPVPLEVAWQRFTRIPFLQLGLESRADWVANGVLYVPLGLLAMRSLRGAGAAAPILALPLCFALAFAVEFTQLFFPPRTVSQNDLIAECLGSVLGAMLAPLAGAWVERFRAVLGRDHDHLLQYAFEFYTLAYVLYCFFPYDLLLSVEEIRLKIASAQWGWLLARPEEVSTARLALNWLVEIALALPIGFAMAGRRPGAGFGPAGAALAGLLLGLFIEVGQFFVASAISQGLSVVSRVAGVAFGAWLRERLRSTGAEAMRDTLRRWGIVALPFYLLLVTAASGWWARDWNASVAENWRETRLLPFYYHYFTTEAHALTSLGSIVVMYLPLSLFVWTCRGSTGTAAAVSATMALLIELGKLFQGGAHPDPTNVLIAAATAWATLRGIDFFTRAGAIPTTTPPAPANAPAPGRAGRTRARWLWHAISAGACLGALSLPGAGAGAALVVAACATLAAWRPVLMLALVPAAMPVFDLAPLTGRFFIDEFDWLLAACLAAVAPLPAREGAAGSHLPRALFVAFGVALAIGAIRGLWPLAGLDAMSLASYYSPLNGLRIVKGAAWAWLFMRAFRRIASHDEERARRHLAAGIGAGLLLTLTVILWERAAFAGWLDFTSDYRVTGPFSAMHKGGAYVECFLAVAAAVPMAWIARSRSRLSGTAAFALLALTAYALAVTYSRNGYAAFAAVLLAGLVATLRGPARPAVRVAAALGLVAALGAIVAPILASPYARERLGQVGQDYAVRAAHWADALAMRDDSVATQALGMGIGSFPASHVWRSAEPVKAALFGVSREADNRFLRLGPGAATYVEQILPAGPASGPLRITAYLRAGESPARVAVHVCRKWMLTSSGCRSATLAFTGQPGQWQSVQADLPAAPPGPRDAIPAPIKFSIATPATKPVIDVDNLRVLAADGAGLLANGDFEAGMDRWFFVTDVDPPWHIHNLGVSVLFDQGWLGVLCWSALLLAALAAGWRGLGRDDPLRIAAFGGVVAFLVSGTLNTLIDAPRFLWLLLLMVALCAGSSRVRPRARRRGREARSPD